MTGQARPAFVAGELVDVEMKAAVVDLEPVAGWMKVRIAGVSLTVPLGKDDVLITRVAPVEWPPVPGDLWRDGYGDLWFAVRGYDQREGFGGQPIVTHPMRMVPARETSSAVFHSKTPDRFLVADGPLELVYREPQPEPAEEDL